MTSSGANGLTGEGDSPVQQELRIAVLRNVTVETLEPYLRREANASGFAADLRFGQFDAIAQQAADSEDPIWADPALDEQ